MAEQNRKPSYRSYFVLGSIETGIYSILGVLLAIAGIIAIAGAMPLFVNGVRDITGTTAILQMIDRLLLVLVVVELRTLPDHRSDRHYPEGPGVDPALREVQWGYGLDPGCAGALPRCRH
jgi:hypothetical protein